MKGLKVGDIFIYIALGILAISGILGMKAMANIGGEISVVILVDGEEVENILLKPGMEAVEIEAKDKSGNYNIIYISYDDVHIVDANCRDRLCIKQGSIRYPGQSIVCLPNKVVIKIIGEKADSPIDAVTYLGRYRYL